jgi:hypothetical protein
MDGGSGVNVAMLTTGRTASLGSVAAGAVQTPAQPATTVAGPASAAQPAANVLSSGKTSGLAADPSS